MAYKKYHLTIAFAISAISFVLAIGSILFAVAVFQIQQKQERKRAEALQVIQDRVVVNQL